MNGAAARKDILAAFLDEVWSGGDVDACDRYIADEYVIHHDPGDPWDGQRLSLDGFKKRVRLSRAPFPDQRFTVQAMVAEENSAEEIVVAVSWLWSATHQGDFPGFPATGNRLHMSGATFYHFDGQDRICGHWQATDRLGIFQQLQKNQGSRQS